MKPEHIKYIVLHCSATPKTMNIGARTIDRWHKDRGWNGIGYHFVIRRNGRIEPGRAVTDVGAHVYGYNRVSWGICMIGGLNYAGKSEDNFTAAQYTATRILIDTLKAFAPDAAVLGHRDLSPDVNGDGVIDKWEWLKDCPCFNAKEWYEAYEAA